ncbi:hypothetical protein [Bacillus sp. REN3]|uniref:hypothetical protein n=1 Tax=Bacillus sp. REN3 TaxID=2802440 RepID=UPI001AEF2E65|nr:hypothetical protein [Bacillus sp. REN3]
MTALLLLASLILNATAIFAIILLYLRQNRLFEEEKQQGRIIKDIEEVFSAYLLEMKDENEKLIELIKETASGEGTEAEKLHEYGVGQEQKALKEATVESSIRKESGVSYQAARKAYEQNAFRFPPGEEAFPAPIPDDPESAQQETADQRPSIEQVLELKKEGLTIEEIARKLNKGKTEIELLLKFHQNGKE